MARNPDPDKKAHQIDVDGGEGIQIGEENEQVNQFINTYVQHQIIEGQFQRAVTWARARG